MATKKTKADFIAGSNVRKPRFDAENFAEQQKQFIVKLSEKMDENGHNIEDLAEAVGVPYSYVIAIKNGMRRIAKAEEATVEKFAKYLNVPVIQVYIWGGFFKPADFINQRSLPDALKSAYARMINDPITMGIVPNEADWNNKKLWSEDAKVAVVRFYEIIAQKLFLEHAEMEMDAETAKKVRHAANRKK